MSFCVIVLRPHFTKKACSGVVPIRAPFFQTVVKNCDTVCLTLAQSFSLLGSKTTHWVPFSIDSSRYKNKRRRLTYFQSESFEVVRAPQTRKPRPLNSRKQFIPRGLRISCCALGICCSGPRTPFYHFISGCFVDAALLVGCVRRRRICVR